MDMDMKLKIILKLMNKTTVLSKSDVRRGLFVFIDPTSLTKPLKYEVNILYI